MQVDIDRIIPVTEARDKFNKIIDEVEGSDNIYVFTKNGKPASVMVGVNHLEKLTGETHGDIEAKMAEAPASDAEPSATVDLTPAAPEPILATDDPFITEPVETPANEPVAAPDNTPVAPQPSAPAQTVATAPATPPPSAPDTTPGPVPIVPKTNAPAADTMASPAPVTDTSPIEATPDSDPFATPDSNNE